MGILHSMFYLRVTAFALVASIVLLFISASPCRASLTWLPGEGWVDESGDETHSTSAKGQLDLARHLESKEDWKNALKGYSYLVRRWPMSIYSGEAQFKIGLMNEKQGEFWRAFKAYQQVVSKYPGSNFFDLAIERQYSIGNLYLAGERQRLWKIPLLPSQDKTVEIFESVVKAAPYGKYAPAAYFQIGQAREKQKKWSQAITAYNTILDKYPGSDFADDAQYQIGFAWFSASSEPDYDQSAAQKSIEAFQDFLVRFPNSEKVSQAEAHIKSLQNRTTQGSFNIARFYERSGNKKAAFIYYNEVLKEDANSEQAKKAKERIETLKVKIAEEEKKALAKADKNKSKVETSFISLHALEEETPSSSDSNQDDALPSHDSERSAHALAGDDSSSEDLPSASETGTASGMGATGIASTGLQSNDALAKENDAIRQADEIIKRSEKEQRDIHLPSDQDPVKQLKKATGIRVKETPLPSDKVQIEDSAKLDQMIASTDSASGQGSKSQSSGEKSQVKEAKENKKDKADKKKEKADKEPKKKEEKENAKNKEAKEKQKTTKSESSETVKDKEAKQSDKQNSKEKPSEQKKHENKPKEEKSQKDKEEKIASTSSSEAKPPANPSAGSNADQKVELKPIEIEPEEPNKAPENPSNSMQSASPQAQSSPSASESEKKSEAQNAPSTQAEPATQAAPSSSPLEADAPSTSSGSSTPSTDPSITPRPPEPSNSSGTSN